MGGAVRTLFPGVSNTHMMYTHALIALFCTFRTFRTAQAQHNTSGVQSISGLVLLVIGRLTRGRCVAFFWSRLEFLLVYIFTWWCLVFIYWSDARPRKEMYVLRACDLQLFPSTFSTIPPARSDIPGLRVTQARRGRGLEQGAAIRTYRNALAPFQSHKHDNSKIYQRY